MNKSELASWLEAKDREWEALLADIGPARMEQPGVNGDWTMKDIVAHLTGWNRWLVARLQAAERGEPSPQPAWPAHLQSDDEINAWIYQAYRNRPLSDVLAETAQTHHQLLAVIGALPADARFELVEPEFQLVWLGDQRFVASEFFDHFRDDHEPDVRAWLARQDKT
jgi:hypothetical protein